MGRFGGTIAPWRQSFAGEWAATLEDYFDQKPDGELVGDAEHAPEKFDAGARRRFLTHFAMFGLKIHACHAAGICWQTLRNYEKQDEVFAAAYEEAYELHKEILVEEARRRATQGCVEYYMYKGHPVMVQSTTPDGQPAFDENDEPIMEPLVKRVYSDRLMELLLKRHIPEFRERYEVDHGFKGGVLRVEAPMSPEDWATALEAHRQEQLAVEENGGMTLEHKP